MNRQELVLSTFPVLFLALWVPIVCASVPEPLASSPLYAPNLNQSFLTDPEKSAAELGMNLIPKHDRIGLAVSRYDLIDGLLAGYEARNGERVLMSAVSNEEGNVNARMLYRDPESGRVLPAMTLAILSGDGGGKDIAILAGGVDVLDALYELRDDAGGRIEQKQALVEFMVSDTGQAALEAIPVLYGQLEPFDRFDPELARMKAPFGAMRMAMELAAGAYAGLPEPAELFRRPRLTLIAGLAATPEDERSYGGEAAGGKVVLSSGGFDPAY